MKSIKWYVMSNGVEKKSVVGALVQAYEKAGFAVISDPHRNFFKAQIAAE